jgi:hypothetical protein
MKLGEASDRSLKFGCPYTQFPHAPRSISGLILEARRLGPGSADLGSCALSRANAYVILATAETRMEIGFCVSKMSSGFRFRVCSVFNPWLLASVRQVKSSKSRTQAHITSHPRTPADRGCGGRFFEPRAAAVIPFES